MLVEMRPPRLISCLLLVTALVLVGCGGQRKFNGSQQREFDRQYQQFIKATTSSRELRQACPASDNKCRAEALKDLSTTSQAFANSLVRWSGQLAGRCSNDLRFAGAYTLILSGKTSEAATYLRVGRPADIDRAVRRLADAEEKAGKAIDKVRVSCPG